MKLLQIYLFIGNLCKYKSSINLLSIRAYMSLQYNRAYINVFVVRMGLMPWAFQFSSSGSISVHLNTEASQWAGLA